MSYKNYVKDVFVEHHVSMGLDVEEAADLFEDHNFASIEKWLVRTGYDLNEFYAPEYLEELA